MMDCGAGAAAAACGDAGPGAAAAGEAAPGEPASGEAAAAEAAAVEAAPGDAGGGVPGYGEGEVAGPRKLSLAIRLACKARKAAESAQSRPLSRGLRCCHSRVNKTAKAPTKASKASCGMFVQ